MSQKHMRDRHGEHCRHHASRARGDEAAGDLDLYALLKTLLDNWQDLFRHDANLRKARSFVSHAMDARNSAAHFRGRDAGTGSLALPGRMRELRLACAQPGDQIAVFGEALQEIAARSAHLYRDGDSYWFSPQPTLNKLAADRARDVSDEQADRRIVEILREEQRGRAGFPRVHAAPDNPADIEDRRSTALIVLPPSAPHDASAGAGSQAGAATGEALERRGSGQHRYRNALVFAAADASNVEAARENARRERAWDSIVNDGDLTQNLTQAQATDAQTQVRRSRDALRQSIRSAWST